MGNGIKNILQINFSRAWGGLEMHMPIISRGLKGMGHNVFVVCPNGSPAADMANRFNLKVIYLENKIKYFDLLTIWRLKKIIEENKIDIIHSHLAKDLWLIIPAARMAGCKNIFFTRHIESHYKKKDMLHYFLHRSLTGAIAITEKIKESLIYTTHIPSKKIKVVYYGLDLEKYKPGYFNKNVLREEYKISEDSLIIGNVGRIEEGKGQEIFLHAASKILKEYPKVKFFIIGEETRERRAEYRIFLESLVKELGLEDYVIFTGFRSDIPAVMNSLDILALTSKKEAFGLVIIEAMAMGKTVIATKSKGTQEIIDSGIDGFLVSPEDSDVLAKTIKGVLNNPEKMKSVGIMARKKVEKTFDYKNNLEELEIFLLGKNKSD